MGASVRHVLEAGLCTACGTCLGLCPRGALEGRWDLDEGLAIRVIDEHCTECGICDRACPGEELDLPGLRDRFLGPLAWRSDEPFTPPALPLSSDGELAPEPDEVALWSGMSDRDFVGSYRRCYCGWAADDALRYRGSSGGAATAILLGALETAFIDGALVTAMDPERPLEPLSFLATTADELLGAVGSKYTVTYPNRLFRDVLRPGKRYAFVGVPCQVEGLRKAQAAVPALRRAFVLVLGLFCGTTYTPRGTFVGMRRSGLQPEEVVSVAYRGDGWPGAFRLTTRWGEVREVAYPDYLDPWFSSHIRARCLVCPDGTNELADIALGDAWLDRFTRPRTTGASFLIARSPLAVRLLSALEPQWIRLEAVDDEEIVAAQRETHEVKRAGVRGNLWLRRVTGRALPRFAGLDLEATRRERWSALAASLKRGFYRAAGRVRYRYRPLDEGNGRSPAAPTGLNWRRDTAPARGRPPTTTASASGGPGEGV